MITLLAAPCIAENTAREAIANVASVELPVIVAIRNADGVVNAENIIDVGTSGSDRIVDLLSVTKTVTAIATLHLVENQGLTLQATLGDLLPDVPADKAQITLHQLLTNTSGIIQSTGGDSVFLSRSEFLEQVLAAPLDARPGTVYSYSNAGFSLLAAIIEIQSGVAYEDYLMEQVIPEGLPEIGYWRAYDAEKSITSDRFWFTGFRRLPVADASWFGGEPSWNLLGNGGLVTTADGFLSFWTAFFNGEIVDDALVAQALTPHIDDCCGNMFYGYGHQIERLADGSLMFGHNGDSDLFSSAWRYVPSSGTTFFSAGRGRAARDAIVIMLASK